MFVRCQQPGTGGGHRAADDGGNGPGKYFGATDGTDAQDTNDPVFQSRGDRLCQVLAFLTGSAIAFHFGTSCRTTF